MKRARTRAEQKEATREKLLLIARRLFTEHGFDDTSIALVSSRARVTHGALYHHFPGKIELFEAVLRDVVGQLIAAISDATAAASGWARIERACDVYLDRCSDPTVRAVFLRDGPRVVPPERFAEIDRAASEPLVTGLIERAIAEGVLRPLPVLLVARMLGAAFAEAGSAIAEADEPQSVHADARSVLLGWLGSLRV
ncbi:MAG TPA: TetR/AcrR family transcriptional regulator [Polyangiales bacterium]|nr:TetR/AcrR family transcriptional regulator [Polyangiales bacterium]